MLNEKKKPKARLLLFAKNIKKRKRFLYTHTHTSKQAKNACENGEIDSKRARADICTEREERQNAADKKKEDDDESARSVSVVVVVTAAAKTIQT